MIQTATEMQYILRKTKQFTISTSDKMWRYLFGDDDLITCWNSESAFDNDLPETCIMLENHIPMSHRISVKTFFCLIWILLNSSFDSVSSRVIGALNFANKNWCDQRVCVTIANITDSEELPLASERNQNFNRSTNGRFQINGAKVAKTRSLQWLQKFSLKQVI